MSSKPPRRRSEDRPAWTPPSESYVAKLNPVETAVHKIKEQIAEVTIEEIPPHCPSCMSTDREKKNGTLVRNISGVSRDGRPFNRVKWTYCKCRACGQGYKVISRINTQEE